MDLTFSQVLDRMVEEFPDQYAFSLHHPRLHPHLRPVPGRRGPLLPAPSSPWGWGRAATWPSGPPTSPSGSSPSGRLTKIGAVLVTMNTAYKIHEAEYLLRQSDTHTLVMIDG